MDDPGPVFGIHGPTIWLELITGATGKPVVCNSSLFNCRQIGD